eukprot:Skav235423  [mRNA]  locus=scaffold924:557213:560458:- [translate_table: standard]
MARHLCVLTTKSAVQAHEPLTWKGGRLVPLWKGSADPSLPEGYRSIFVSDYSAKIYHQCIRASLVQAWERSIDGLQFGGRAAHGTDMAHHLLQTHMMWSKASRQPAATLFVDLKSAFYSVLRQGLLRNVPGDHEDAHLLHFLASQGVHPDQAISSLQAAGRDHATLGISPHMERVLRDLLCNTHFCVDLVETPVRTARGTRPGDPIGDILFNMVMTVIMSDVRTRIQRDTEAVWLGQQGPSIVSDGDPQLPPSAFVDIAFVGDAAIMCHAPSNEQVADLVTVAAQAVTAAAALRGLEVNYAAKKTEVMLLLAGKGTMAFKQQLVDKGSVLRWTDGSSSFCLRVVLSYKHLGTWLQAGAVHGKEILSRAGALRSSWGPLVRPLYSRPQIALRQKVSIFRSLSLSRFLYNVHVWVGVTDREWTRWTNALRLPLLSIVQSRLRHVRRMNLPLEVLVGLVRLPLPMDLVHVARLRYLARLLKVCPPVFWAWTLAISEVPRSWLADLRSSLAWFLQFYPYPVPLDLQSDLPEWFAFVALDPSWKGRIRTALAACEGYRSAQAEAYLWNRSFDEMVVQYGGTLPDQSHVSVARPWICDLCDSAFPSKAALALHSAKRHGYRTATHFFALDGWCSACVRDFHTRSRLRHHLAASPNCLPVLRACFAPLSAEVVEQLDAQELADAHVMHQGGWHATKALLPRLRMAGPRLPSPGTPEAQWMLARSVARNPQDVPAFHQLSGRHAAALPEPIAPSRQSVVDALPPFVMQSAGGSVISQGRMMHRSLATEYAKCHFKHLVVVHFFSGFRRDRDIHHIVEQSAVAAGVCVMVLSVDLCMQKDAVHADLSTLASTSWWLDRVRSGQVIAAGGGPPCETYTAARLAEGGPRPVRSAQHLYGCPHLTRREWKQVNIGTTLVHFILRLALELAWRGGAAWAEHPQWPLWAAHCQPPSIWSMRAVRLLRQFSCVNVVSFDQCVVGADAVKPTTLLLVRMSDVRAALLARGCGGRCHHGRGAHRSLIGKNWCGQFNTARGKIYPPPLNEVLGRSMIDFVKSVVPLHNPTFASDELDVFRELQSSVFEDRAVVQADYHG